MLVLQSTDSGRTWQRVGTLPDLSAGSIPGPLRAVVDGPLVWIHAALGGGATDNRAILVSPDGGRTWSQVPLPGAPRRRCGTSCSRAPPPAGAWARCRGGAPWRLRDGTLPFHGRTVRLGPGRDTRWSPCARLRAGGRRVR